MRRIAFRLLFVLLAVPLLCASCSKVTVAGVVITFDIDRTSVPLLDPDTLYVKIWSSDPTQPIIDGCPWHISEPASAWFPKTLTVASDGSPTESFHLTAAVLKAGVTLARADNEVYEVPTDHVAQFSVIFSGSCGAQLSAVTDPTLGATCPEPISESLCPPGETCSPATGMCMSDVICLGLACGAGVDAASDSDASRDASLVEAQSCAADGPGMTNCAPGGVGTESCCTSLDVTGGTFYRTYSSDADGGAYGEADPATVSSFRLDKYDVTVGRFRQFLAVALPQDAGLPWLPAAGSGKHTHLNGGQGLASAGVGGSPPFEQGWDAADWNSKLTFDLVGCAGQGPTTFTPTATDNELMPITCVNWFEAYAFCIWDGGFLPSEAEWEYAAAGGALQRKYPWGEASPGTNQEYASFGVANVGTAASGTGLFGQLDLSGNVFQWALDAFTSAYPPCLNCTNMFDSGMRVQRGGPLQSGQTVAPDVPAFFPTERVGDTPDDRTRIYGFRCARSP